MYLTLNDFRKSFYSSKGDHNSNLPLYRFLPKTYLNHTKKENYSMNFKYNKENISSVFIVPAEDWSKFNK